MSDNMVSIPREVALQLLEDAKKLLNQHKRGLKKSNEDMEYMSTESGKIECQELINQYASLIEEKQKLVDALQNAIN